MVVQGMRRNSDNRGARATKLNVRRLAIAAALVALCVPLGAPSAASAEEAPVEVNDVGQAFFVAGDVARLSNAREGTEELVLEKALQQIYADEPDLSPDIAEGYIEEMKTALAGPGAPSKGTLEVMAGNQRVLAILATLEATGLPAPAKLALTHLAALALAGSSDIYASAGTPLYFEPLADERTNLLYTTFAPSTVLRATYDLSTRDGPFAYARDALWGTASDDPLRLHGGEVGPYELVHEIKNPGALAAFNSLPQSLINELESDGWTTLKVTRKQLVAIFTEDQTESRDQVCEHGGTEEAIGTATIPGVPQLRCSGGALLIAAHAVKTEGESSSEVQAKLTAVQQQAAKQAEVVKQEQAAMSGAAELMRPADEANATVLAAAGQAQTAITEGEQKWANFEAEKRVTSDIKSSLEVVGGIAGAAVSFATDNESEGVSGMIGAAFQLWGLIEQNVYESKEPTNPQTLTLEDIGALRTQMAGFEQYTHEALHAVSTQVAQLTAQLAQDNYELKFELTSFAERLQSSQQTVFRLQSQLQTLFSTQVKAELQTAISDSVGWQKRTGSVLPAQKMQESLVALNKYATEVANGALVTREYEPYTLEGAGRTLTGTKTGELEELSESVSYLDRFPLEQGWSAAAVPASLANTTFWNAAARAYSQVMLENPQNVTPANVSYLKGLEAEGVSLDKAQQSWATASAKGQGSGNQTLNGALSAVRNAAASGGSIEGHESLQAQIEGAAAEVLNKNLPKPEGNYTHLTVWGNAYQGSEQDTANHELAKPTQTIASWAEQVHYEVLSSPHDFTESEIHTYISPVYLNAIRLGILGPKGGTSTIQAEFKVSGTTCTVSLTMPGYTNGSAPCGTLGYPIPEYCLITHPTPVECRENLKRAAEHGAPEERVAKYVDLDLLELQAESAEAAVKAAESQEGPLSALAGAKSLVQAYVTLGLPRAVSTDSDLQSDIAGAKSAFLYPSSPPGATVLEELKPLASDTASTDRDIAESLTSETKSVSIVEEEIPQAALLQAGGRAEKWAADVEAHARPYIEGSVTDLGSEPEPVDEHSPLIESTLNRLQLTRDVLTEAKAPTAETIAPTGITATEATLDGEVNSYGSTIESCRFEYGSTTYYGHTIECSSVPQPSSEGSVVSANVSNWTKNGSFHARLVVTTWAGTSYGEDIKVQLSEAAKPPPSTTPTVETGEVTRIARRQALLHGAVNPNGVAVSKCWATIQEEGGKNQKLSFGCIEGVGTGFSPTQVLVNARKLYPGEKYSYQFHAENVLGVEAEGAIGHFETLPKVVRK